MDLSIPVKSAPSPIIGTAEIGAVKIATTSSHNYPTGSESKPVAKDSQKRVWLIVDEDWW